MNIFCFSHISAGFLAITGSWSLELQPRGGYNFTISEDGTLVAQIDNKIVVSNVSVSIEQNFPASKFWYKVMLNHSSTYQNWNYFKLTENGTLEWHHFCASTNPNDTCDAAYKNISSYCCGGIAKRVLPGEIYGLFNIILSHHFLLLFFLPKNLVLIMVLITYYPVTGEPQTQGNNLLLFCSFYYFYFI